MTGNVRRDSAKKELPSFPNDEDALVKLINSVSVQYLSDVNSEDEPGAGWTKIEQQLKEELSQLQPLNKEQQQLCADAWFKCFCGISILMIIIRFFDFFLSNSVFIGVFIYDFCKTHG